MDRFDRAADKQVRLWDATTGRSRVALGGHERAPQVVAFSRDGKHLVSSGYDEKLLLWDTKTPLKGGWGVQR